MQPLIIAVSTLMLIGLCHSAPNDDPNSCECVPKSQCADDGVVNFDAHFFDIRVQPGVPKPGEQCISYRLVCCLPNKIKAPPATSRQKPSRSCGLSDPKGVHFFFPDTKDDEALFRQYPWMVALLGKNSKQKYIRRCGGSLIHPSVILTAAHYVDDIHPSLLKVRAGKWDNQAELELYTNQDRNIAEVIVHENFKDFKNFKNGSLFNDFALLRLDKPFDFDDHIDVICLPDDGVIPDNTRCFITSFAEGIQFNVDLPVVPFQKCQDDLRKAALGQNFKLHESFMCAGGELGKDSSNRDAGSPLVCQYPNDPGRYYQAGIVSWGVGHGHLNVPGVYSDVVYAKPWILHHLDQWYKASLIPK